MNETIAEPPCPYVGLQPYTETERDYFFGRERDQRIVSSNLYAAPLTVLYGTSGVGKTSILLAGIVPYLQRQPRTAVIVFREWQENSFFETLRRQCLVAVEAAQQKPLTVDPTLPFDELLDAAARAFGGSILIVFDQFEEYFLYHPESQTGSAFDAEFARAVNREEVDASFLIALREDSLSKLDRFRERIPNLLANTLRLQHLDAAGAESAIRKPLDVFNQRFSTAQDPVTIQDQLVTAVISQVRAGQVQLGQSGGAGRAETHDEAVRIEAPFLQLVMTRLWDEERKAGSRTLRLGTLNRLGGAAEIVRMHLDGVMAKLSAPQQEVCSRFFDRLVTPSGSKIACRVDDLAKWAGDLAEDIAPVLDALSGNRILRGIARTEGRQASEMSYEIYHDVLAPAILDWRGRYIAVQQRAEAERRADEQQRRAEEQAKIAHRLRRRSAALVALLVIMAGLAGWAAIQRQLALESARLAASRELTAAAINDLSTDPERSVVLALQAVLRTYSVDRSVTPEAENVLRRVVQASRMQLTLRGHSDQVRGIAFSPDGTRVVTASWDHTARIWDSASGRELLSVSHPARLTAVAYSPDGARFATAGDDGTVKVWDAASGAASGKVLLEFTGPSAAVDAVAFSSDGARLATASRDNAVKIWDAATGHELHAFAAPWVFGLAFSPDGTLLAAASASDQSASRVWDISSGRERFTVPGQVNSVAFSPDGKLLATAGRDKTGRVWDVATGEQVLALLGHTDQVRDIAFNGKGTQLATASGDGSAKIWDAATGQLLFSLLGHEAWVNGVAFSPDGARLATASGDRTAKIWNIAGHTSAVYGIAFSPDGKRLATASGDNTAKLWDVASAAAILTLSGHTDTVFRVAFSSDGKYVATASFDKTARIWDATTGEEVRVFIGHLDQLRDVAFSQDGRLLATASADLTARLWDIESGRMVFAFRHNGQVRAVAFSSDGQRLATAGWDNAVKIWDVATGKNILTASGNNARYNDVAFSPDGSRFATVTTGQTVNTWDATTGAKLLSLTGGGHQLLALTFSPDGSRFATAAEDSTVAVWEPVSGKLLQTEKVSSEAINDVAFSPDGKQLATASSDKTFQYSPLNIDDLIALAKLRVTRPLTPKECREFMHIEECIDKP